MWKRVTSTVVFVAAICVAAVPVAAQVLCIPRTIIATQLARVHGEIPVARGLTLGGELLEVFASSSGSWTIVVTTPRMLSCPMASGESWSDAPETRQLAEPEPSS